MPNTHGAWLDDGPDDGKPQRIAGGTEAHCDRVLIARLESAPGRTGFVRPLSESELR
jgi:hypothetical protein